QIAVKGLKPQDFLPELAQASALRGIARAPLLQPCDLGSKFFQARLAPVARIHGPGGSSELPESLRVMPLQQALLLTSYPAGAPRALPVGPKGNKRGDADLFGQLRAPAQLAHRTVPITCLTREY